MILPQLCSPAATVVPSDENATAVGRKLSKLWGTVDSAAPVATVHRPSRRSLSLPPAPIAMLAPEG